MKANKNLILTAVLLFAATLTQAAQNPGTAGNCDRACLRGIADAYVAAMVAHDPAKVPLAANFRLVENVRRIDTKTGLWTTASAEPGEFRIYVPDPMAQQIGYLSVLQSGGKPAILGLRLKLEGGRIAEAEHLVVYNVGTAALENLVTPRKAFAVPVPEGYRDSRAQLLRIGATYYDALDENNGSLAPFADDCVRFENGTQTSRTAKPRGPATASQSMFDSAGLGCAAQMDTLAFLYITKIDNRRVWVADEETGVVYGLSHFRHAMDRKEYPLYGVPGIEKRVVDLAPFDMPAVHVYKVWGGKIHEIEAIGVSMPYNSATGWER
jgi:hypothetical protein